MSCAAYACCSMLQCIAKWVAAEIRLYPLCLTLYACVVVCGGVLQCAAWWVAVYVLRCVAVCCGVLRCVAVCCGVLHGELQLVEVETCLHPLCPALHMRAAVRCSVLQCVAVCCIVCCSVLQCVAVCCSSYVALHIYIKTCTSMFNKCVTS